MEFKFFTDLIDALGKVAGGLKAIINPPKSEREYRLHRSLRAVTSKKGDTRRSSIWHLEHQKLGHPASADVSHTRHRSEVELSIGQQFQKLISEARGAAQDTQRAQTVRDALTGFRVALVSERQELTLYVTVLRPILKEAPT
jgi:hypothetical protein